MSNPVVVVLIVLLLLMVLGGLPAFGFHSYGWVPSGGLGLILVIVLVVLLLRG